MAAKPNEIQITRVYDAPVKLVWDAWTDPKKAALWWGPRGFTITTKSKDLRVGGKWIYTMHGPDGVDYPNITTYHEIVPYEKMVYDHGGNEDRPKLFTVTVTFKENKGKTTMKMTMALDSAEAALATKGFIKTANGNSTWDRLGEYLEQELGGKDTFIINRVVEGDLETVFELWANPAKLASWIGPAGANMKFTKGGPREGEASLWSMTTPDGQTSVTFNAEGPKETRITLRKEIPAPATEPEKKAFKDMKSNMMVSWNQSFDKIDELLR